MFGDSCADLEILAGVLTLIPISSVCRFATWLLPNANALDIDAEYALDKGETLTPETPTTNPFTQDFKQDFARWRRMNAKMSLNGRWIRERPSHSKP